ncbi:hypothetical protein B0H13DRAFT_2388961 [Mycena leptocephala]|nr:hypothetical protein B0H13DRAFT_2388961 [Mycena leptocephala]
MTIPVATPSHFHVASHRARCCPGRRPRRCLHFPLRTLTSMLHLRLLPVPKSDRAAASSELFAKGLVMFDFTLRLVSFDGSPLPMTRHPSGVAAHLLSPRGPSSRLARGSPRSPSKSPCSSDLNPPHVPHILHIGTPHPIPAAIPIANLNRPHTSHLPVEPPLRISSPDRHTSKSNPPHVAAAAPIRPRIIEPSIDSNPPHTSHAATVPRRVVDPTVNFDSLNASHPSHVHLCHSPCSDHSATSSIPRFPPVKCLRSPPIYLPVHVPLPDSKPTAVPLAEDLSPPIT